MRLVYECYACDPKHGSEPFNGWRWTRALAEAGHEVDLITTEAGASSTKAALAELCLENVEVHVLPRSTRLLRLRKGFYLDYARWLTKAGCLSTRLPAPDLAHHLTWGNVAFGTRLWRTGAPTVLGPCGGGQIMPAALMEFLESERTMERVRTVLVRAAHRSTVLPGARLDLCHVLASNVETRNFAASRQARSVRLFPDPVLDERDVVEAYRARTHGGEVRVLWVGRMLPRKGLELAIKAFGSSMPGSVMRIVGDGPRRAAAEHLVAVLGLGSRVKFLGSVSREMVGNEMRNADVFFFASLRDSMPAQLLEAMAAGLPIVTLNIYGNPLLVPEKGGILVPVTDPKQIVVGLTQALDKLVTSPELRESMGRANHAAATMHTMHRKVATMEKIYSEILASL